MNVSREELKSLEEYRKLLFEWNSKINLISQKSYQNFWNNHIVDSLQLLNYIEDYNLSIIDVGSGNGLPGLVLSICGVKNITLVESNTKKCAFLLQGSRLSNNKVNIINDRIENINASFDILVSRGFASLDNIFTYTRNISVGRYVLHKGRTYDLEFAEARKRWNFECKLHNSITSESSKILEIKKVTKLIN